MEVKQNTNLTLGQLLDPQSSVWQQISATTIPLEGTPAAFQPTPAIRETWADKPTNNSLACGTLIVAMVVATSSLSLLLIPKASQKSATVLEQASLLTTCAELSQTAVNLADCAMALTENMADANTI